MAGREATRTTKGGFKEVEGSIRTTGRTLTKMTKDANKLH